MAAAFYVTIEGTKQGVFKASAKTGPAQKWSSGKIQGLDFHYEASRDGARSGSAGKRMHGPVVLTKAWDAATPLIFTAFVTNEALKSVLFEFLTVSHEGVESVYQTIELKDAWVSHVNWYLAEEHDRVGDRLELEDVSFGFNQIRVENLPGQTEAADSWSSELV
jgi:type VI secretion system secreted protein Hcp